MRLGRRFLIILLDFPGYCFGNSDFLGGLIWLSSLDACLDVRLVVHLGRNLGEKWGGCLGGCLDGRAGVRHPIQSGQ